MATQSNNDFWRNIRREAEPIISHAFIVLSLDIALVLIGLLILLLEHMFPKHQYYFELLEKIDIWIALALLCMFGIYTLLIVGIRFYKGFREEILSSSKASKKGRDQ